MRSIPELLGRGGATLSGVLFDQVNLVGVNVGDSRIYEMQKGGKVVQLSTDNTVGRSN